MRILKFSISTVFLLLFVLFLLNLELVTYGISQAKGQFSMIYHAQRFNEIQDDVPDSIKTNMALVVSTKQFAYDSLGLEATDVYQSVNLERNKYTMYVVTGSLPYQLTPKLWRFPVVGEVPYKGFFSLERALKERDKIAKQGWDSGIRTAGGWSTLGWFENPLLYEQLTRSTGDLVNLTLHEMAHESIYVSGDTDLNENLATFIADYGTLYFLRAVFGEESDEFNSYVEKEEDYQAYADHFIRGASTLDSLYRTFSEGDSTTNNALKLAQIQRIVNSLDSIDFHVPETYSALFENQLPNNTYFLSFLRYRSDQDAFAEELQSDFQGDIKKYIQELKNRYNSGGL